MKLWLPRRCRADVQCEQPAEQEFYAIVEKDDNVRAAWKAAHDAFYEATRTPHGLLDWLKLARLRFVFSYRIKELLEAYNKATECRHPTSDIDTLRNIIVEEATDYDGKTSIAALHGTSG
jgi:hypothetical protein